MQDDPDWWRSPISREDWERELAEAKENRRKAREAWEEAKAVEAAVYQMRIMQAQGNYTKRNWAIWRERISKGTTYKQLGRDYGISNCRAGDIIQKCSLKVKSALHPGINIQWDNVSDEIREATLGVEFVFRNELTLEDKKGWDQLEFDRHDSSAYRNPVDWWKPEWGHQDTSPAKPKPAYTYYKTIIEKEQSDGD